MIIDLLVPKSVFTIRVPKFSLLYNCWCQWGWIVSGVVSWAGFASYTTS